MGRTRFHTFAYHMLRITKWIAFIGAALLIVSQRTVPESWPNLAESAILWIRGFAGCLSFICVVYGTLADRIVAYPKPPQTWDAIHGFLDNLRDYFVKDIEDPLHLHRVTLFGWTGVSLARAPFVVLTPALAPE